MNKHRLYRKSKKLHGRGFFKDLIIAVGKEAKPILEDKTKTFVRDKLNQILSKKKGAGLKIIPI